MKQIFARRASFLAALAGLALSCKSHLNDSNFPETATIRISFPTLIVSPPPESNGSSTKPSISRNGKRIVFRSNATNLVSLGPNLTGKFQIYLRDETDHSTTLISISTTATFANGDCDNPVISPDGNFVVFESLATNLSAATDSNGQSDVFLRDVLGNQTKLISLNSGGTAAGNGASTQATVSNNGLFVAFTSTAIDIAAPDANATSDVFMRDVLGNSTELISINSGATAGGAAASQRPSISEDGRYVAFQSLAADLVGGDTNGKFDIFVRDTNLNSTTRISSGVSGEPDGDCTNPRISGDGLSVAFESLATNLVAGDINAKADIFVRQNWASVSAATILVSVHNSGAQATGDSTACSISFNGKAIAFQSTATNLVNGDTNAGVDVFVRLLSQDPPETRIVSVRTGGAPTNNFAQSIGSSISGDGITIAFSSDATNLESSDSNGLTDIFIRNPLPEQK